MIIDRRLGRYVGDKGCSLFFGKLFLNKFFVLVCFSSFIVKEKYLNELKIILVS